MTMSPRRTLSYPVPRILRRFESQDGALVWQAPIVDYEWESAQNLVAPEAAVIGADYGYDLLGNQPSPLAPGAEHLRFTLYEPCGPGDLDDEFGRMRARLYRMGLGKGFTVDHRGVERWAYMRLLAMPTYNVLGLATPAAQKLLVVVADFRRASPWFSVDLSDGGGPFVMDDVFITFTVNNPGDAKVYNAILTLKGTFDVPLIQNTSTNPVKSLYSQRSGSSPNDWLRYDSGRPAVEFSADGGTTFTPDYSNFIRQPGQVQLMVLEPGDNAFTGLFSGFTDAVLEVSFYPAYYS